MPSLPPRTSLPVAALAVLAEAADFQLADALLDRGAATAASLLRVRMLDDEVELGWRTLPGDQHPVDELVGTTVGPDVWAVGVAATGVAHHLDDPAGTVRVRTVHLVGRDGSWASRWSPLDTDVDADVDDDDVGPGAAACGLGDEDGRPVGRIDDVCRRCLDLATPSPPGDTAGLWAQRWLDAVIEAATSGRRRPARWDDVAALHPALPALRGRPRRGAPSPVALATMATQLTTLRDWPGLRRACAAGTWTASGVAPEVAAWLDDGAFARWVLGTFPELDDLRAVVADLLPPSTVAAIEASLAAAGVVSR